MRFCFDWQGCLTCDGEPPTIGRVLHLWLDQDRYPGMPDPLVATLENVTPKQVAHNGVIKDGYEFCVNIPDEQMPEINGQLVSSLDQCCIALIDCVDCCEVLTDRVNELEDRLGEEQTYQFVTEVEPDCSTGTLRIKVTKRTVTWIGPPIGVTDVTYFDAPCAGYGYGYGAEGGGGESPSPEGDIDLNPF